MHTVRHANYLKGENMISIGRPVSGDDFVNRTELLKQLHAIYPTDSTALVGPRRIGKSSIAEEFLRTLKRKKTIKFKFNVQKNIGPPGKFAVRMLRSFLSAWFDYNGKKDDLRLDELEMNHNVMIDVADRAESLTLRGLARFLVAYYPPPPQHDRPVLERILNFFDEFSAEMGVRAAIVLDEFQDIELLERFDGFKNGNLLGFLEGAFFGQKNVWYMFTGSAVRIMTNILEAPDSPFYGRVKRLNVKPFGKDDTAQLVCKCTEKPISAEALDFLFSLSKGHPYYTAVIISAAARAGDERSMITRDSIEKAFMEELFEGALNSHCTIMFESSLGRMKKPGVFLKEILRALSAGEATLTELASRVGRKSGFLSRFLGNLFNLDLIERNKKKYRVADNILEIWLKTVYGQEETDLHVSQRKIRESYREYIGALKTETGIFFESYLREMLGKFDGRKFKEVHLPRFSSVEGINAFDSLGEVFGKPSNIEIDALCQGDENWLCEFKYKRKAVKKRHIDLLIKQKSFIEKKLAIKIDKMMYIAKSGFSEEAVKSEVWCVTFRELNELLAMLKMKKTSQVLKMND